LTIRDGENRSTRRRLQWAHGECGETFRVGQPDRVSHNHRDNILHTLKLHTKYGIVLWLFRGRCTSSKAGEWPLILLAIFVSLSVRVVTAAGN
jgi:hypothetical protein